MNVELAVPNRTVGKALVQSTAQLTIWIRMYLKCLNDSSV
jgi:hypothetical protein